jgi:hypothetical protein
MSRSIIFKNATVVNEGRQVVTDVFVKDGIIQKQTLDISGMEKQVAHLRVRNQELHDRVNDLSFQLDEEKKQVELKAKVRELEKIRKELAEKDKKNT